MTKLQAIQWCNNNLTSWPRFLNPNLKAPGDWVWRSRSLPTGIDVVLKRIVYSPDAIETIEQFDTDFRQ